MWTQAGIGAVRARGGSGAGAVARPRGAARGGAPARGSARLGIASRPPPTLEAPPRRLRLEGSPLGALDVAGAALVLASPLLLWAFFLAAVG